MSIREQVLNAVLSGYNTSYDIAIHTGLKTPQINNPLHVLEKEKVISRVSYEKIERYVYVCYTDYDPSITHVEIYNNSAESQAPKQEIKLSKPKDVSTPFSTNENHYGLFPKRYKYNWAGVKSEARSIEYRENDYLNKLPFKEL